MKVLWRTIPEYPVYEVSNYGQVKNTRTGRILRPSTLMQGYHRISLYNAQTKQKIQRPIHTLVARAFIGDRPQGLQCCHLDGNKNNNSVKNLIYATPQVNSDHKYIHGAVRFGESSPNSKLTSEDVHEMRRLRREERTSIRRLASIYGVGQSTTHRIVTGKSWQHLTFKED
jgi:hypothetical protein